MKRPNNRRRADRQRQALERQVAREQRTTAQQIARLNRGGYVAKRERARLAKEGTR